MTTEKIITTRISQTGKVEVFEIIIKGYGGRYRTYEVSAETKDGKFFGNAESSDNLDEAISIHNRIVRSLMNMKNFQNSL